MKLTAGGANPGGQRSVNLILKTTYTRHELFETKYGPTRAEVTKKNVHYHQPLSKTAIFADVCDNFDAVGLRVHFSSERLVIGLPTRR